MYKDQYKIPEETAREEKQLGKITYSGRKRKREKHSLVLGPVSLLDAALL